MPVNLCTMAAHAVSQSAAAHGLALNAFACFVDAPFRPAYTTYRTRSQTIDRVLCYERSLQDEWQGQDALRPLRQVL